MPDTPTQEIIRPVLRKSLAIRHLTPRLPERGKIKIGMLGETRQSQAGGTYQLPKKLDHFRITTLDRGSDGNFLVDAEIHKRLGGDQLKRIPVRLLYDEIELNFPTRYACFIGRTLWCSGDGDVATRISTEPPKNKGELKNLIPQPREVSCPCERQDPRYSAFDKCKMNGNLTCIIDGASGLGGVWSLRTTSFNTITGLLSSMAFIREVTGGVLANIPLNLCIQPKQATNPVDSSAVTIYVVGLEYDGTIQQLQELGHQIALARATTHVSIKEIETEARRRLALAPPDIVLPGDEDNGEIVEEFYPEQQEGFVADGGAAPPRPTREDFQDQEQQQDPSTAGGDQPPVDEELMFYCIDNEGEVDTMPLNADLAEQRLRAIFREAFTRSLDSKPGAVGRLALQTAISNNEATLTTLPENIRQRLLADAAEAQKKLDAATTAVPPTGDGAAPPQTERRGRGGRPRNDPPATTAPPPTGDAANPSPDGGAPAGSPDATSADPSPGPSDTGEPSTGGMPEVTIVPFDKTLGNGHRVWWKEAKIVLDDMRRRGAYPPEYTAFRQAHEEPITVLKEKDRTWYKILDGVIANGEAGR